MKLNATKQVLNALADETRLRILNLLGAGELCVCDLMRVLKEPQSKVSRHLGYLRRAKLVTSRKEGLWVHYELTQEGKKVFKCFFDTFCAGNACVDEFTQDKTELHRKKEALVSCCK